MKDTQREACNKRSSAVFLHISISRTSCPNDFATVEPHVFTLPITVHCLFKLSESIWLRPTTQKIMD